MIVSVSDDERSVLIQVDRRTCAAKPVESKEPAGLWQERWWRGD